MLHSNARTVSKLHFKIELEHNTVISPSSFFRNSFGLSCLVTNAIWCTLHGIKLYLKCFAGSFQRYSRSITAGHQETVRWRLLLSTSCSRSTNSIKSDPTSCIRSCSTKNLLRNYPTHVCNSPGGSALKISHRMPEMLRFFIRGILHDSTRRANILHQE